MFFFGKGLALYGKYLLFKKKVPRKPFPNVFPLRVPEFISMTNAPSTGLVPDPVD